MSQKFDVDSTTGVLTPNGTGAITIGYSVSGSNATITGFSPKSYSGALVLPTTLGGNNVSSIGNGAFEGASSLTSVTIPEGIISIGAAAFYGATSLTSINIPASVTTFADGDTFQGCSSLQSITVDQNNANYSSSLDGVLFNKSQTVLVSFPCGKTGSYIIPESVDSLGNWSFAEVRLSSVTIPYGVTSIGNYAFYKMSSLTSIIIPASVTSIGSYAFGYVLMTSITIPAGVTSIGEGAFAYTSKLESILVDENNNDYSSLDGVLFNKNKTILLKYPTGSSRVSYTVPSSVETIEGRSFAILLESDNNTLRTIILNNGLKNINMFAFRYVGIESITIPASVTSIGNYAFFNATRLTSITIPASVTSIGYYAFLGSGLTSASVSVDRLGGANFPGAAGAGQTIGGKTDVTVTTFKIFSGSGELTNGTGNLSGATSAIIDGYTSIGNGAFDGASSLTSVTIPEGVISIGAYAFYGATSLTSINIPASVTTFVDGDTFQGCSNLQSITVDQNNANYSSSLDGVLFNKSQTVLVSFPCGKTGSYIIPESVNSLGDWAFAEVRLSSVTIPSGVTSIGSGAFDGASSLTSLTFAEGSLLTSIGTYAFNYATGLTSISISANVTSIGNNAFRGASSLTSISIPAGVTSIGFNAFNGATSLTTVYLPSPNGLNITSPSVGPVSFFGVNVTILIPPTIEEIASRVISNTGLINLLSSMSVNAAGISSAIEEVPSDSNIAYRARLTIPAGNLSALSEEQKVELINKVKEVYAEELEVNVNKFVVVLSDGSIIITVDVLAAGVTSESMVPICFPAGTPVRTDQGEVAIEKLNPSKHTIRGKEIVAITRTRPLFEEIVLIGKNALMNNVPSADTEISKEHRVYYKGSMIKANELVEKCEGVKRIAYNGETLYNVLLKKHDKMMVNNLICETLDPENIMSKICGGKYNKIEREDIYAELNEIIKRNAVEKYKKLYMRL